MKAQTVSVVQNVSPMSRVMISASAMKYGQATSARPVNRPTSRVKKRAAVYAAINTQNRPHSAVYKRALHSDLPNTPKAIAVAQYCMGGFSKYFSPFSRGVT